MVIPTFRVEAGEFCGATLLAIDVFGGIVVGAKLGGEDKNAVAEELTMPAAVPFEFVGYCPMSSLASWFTAASNGLELATSPIFGLSSGSPGSSTEQSIQGFEV